MSVQMVLLPVFVLVALTFALMFGIAGTRGALKSGPVKADEVKLTNTWPGQAAQFGDCYSSQFELPVLFYVLIAIALPLRHADLVIVMLSWVFVITRFVDAGVFVTSNDLQQRSMAWFAGVLVLFAMWLYFAVKILLLI